MTQELFVINELKENGEISRNLCLQNYISRLGAIICELKKKGYEFDTEWRGGDYVYIWKNRRPTWDGLQQKIKQDKINKFYENNS